MRFKLYSDSPVRAMRQLIVDAALVVWLWLWIRVAIWIHDKIMIAAQVSDKVRDGAGGIAENLHNAGNKAGTVPMIGDALSSPLNGAGNAAQGLSDAGASATDTVTTTALLFSVLFVSAPVLAALLPWLWYRLRFAQQAGMSKRLATTPAGLHLLAIRAAANCSLPKLEKALQDTDTSRLPHWEETDTATVEKLAAIELKRMGLRLPRAS